MLTAVSSKTPGVAKKTCEVDLQLPGSKNFSVRSMFRDSHLRLMGLEVDAQDIGVRRTSLEFPELAAA